MQRLGHDSVRAAMIYRHSTTEADRHIADAINTKIKAIGEHDPGGEVLKLAGHWPADGMPGFPAWWAQLGSNQ
jgi:hypothetical protein